MTWRRCRWWNSEASNDAPPLAVFSTPSFALGALADERILSFESDIAVHQEGWIDVTETITVRAEGRQIRRGIYRDFPTRYRDRFGNSVDVSFTPRSVQRNGAPERFFL